LLPPYLTVALRRRAPWRATFLPQPTPAAQDRRNLFFTEPFLLRQVLRPREARCAARIPMRNTSRGNGNILRNRTVVTLMGLDLVYRTPERKLVTRFSLVDAQTIEQLREHVPKAIALAFDVSEFGVEEPVSLPALREAVEQVDELVSIHPELLPYSYQFRVEYIEAEGRRIDVSGMGFNSRGLGGIRLPDDDVNYYALSVGVNECRLDKLVPQEDGTGLRTGQIDLRGRTQLQTANCGVIIFRKRRAKSSLRRILKEIRGFLSDIHAIAIAKMVG
jgi:hypothetical protein